MADVLRTDLKNEKLRIGKEKEMRQRNCLWVLIIFLVFLTGFEKMVLSAEAKGLFPGSRGNQTTRPDWSRQMKQKRPF